MTDIKTYANGEEIPVIQVTKDYSIFKRMEGNREVTARRASKIRKSIEEIGYVPNPIIVNENMEIIDGQGRLEALKSLELPVFYIVVPGLALKDCISMNVNSTKWGVKDYIMSFAETGNEDYKRLLNLIESYDLPLTTVCCAATGVMQAANSKIKTGHIVLDEEYYRAVDAMLAYVDRFVPIMKEHRISNKAPVYSALCYCYQLDDVDNERLLQSFERYWHKLTSATATLEVFDAITEIYNFGRRTNKVYITTKYREYLDGRYPWYASYWGARQKSALEKDQSHD